MEKKPARLIDADELIDELKYLMDESIYTLGSEKYMTIMRLALEAAMYRVYKMPTVKAAPVVHSYWHDVHGNGFRCTVCGNLSDYRSLFCPDCGASMLLEDKNEQ